jgi:arabinan endo-1,5-alpha-L-arabinosidase
MNQGAHPPHMPYTNPVYARDFADVGVLRQPEGYYAYASQGQTPQGVQNIQCAFSPDLVHWAPLPDALPVKAPWAPAQDYWAPDVVQLAARDYRLFFNAQVLGSGQGIGVARAETPVGPFTVVGEPLVHGERYRHIDPKAVRDPHTGRWHLAWGSCYGPILLKELRDDLLGFRDLGQPPHELLQPNPQARLTQLYEAAWITARFDAGRSRFVYYLYTSGPDAFGDESYTVQVARSEQGIAEGYVTLAEATGRPDSVIYRSNATFVNPGAAAIATDGAGQEWLLSHATLRADIPDYDELRRDPARLWNTLRSARRVLLLDPIHYADGWPYLPGGAPSLYRGEGPVHPPAAREETRPASE